MLRWTEALPHGIHTPMTRLLSEDGAVPSGGQEQKLAIARAVYHKGSFMIMDEPTTALDIYYKDSVHKLMNEYKKMNGILIISTHDKEEMDMSDHCLELKNGVFNKLK